MGHYRSEMGFESLDEENRLRRARKRAELIAALKKRIDGGDLAEVLADIIDEFSCPDLIADQLIRDAGQGGQNGDQVRGIKSVE